MRDTNKKTSYFAMRSYKYQPASSERPSTSPSLLMPTKSDDNGSIHSSEKPVAPIHPIHEKRPIRNLEHLLDNNIETDDKELYEKANNKELDESINEDYCDEEVDISIAYTDDSFGEGDRQYMAMSISPLLHETYEPDEHDVWRTADDKKEEPKKTMSAKEKAEILAEELKQLYLTKPSFSKNRNKLIERKSNLESESNFDDINLDALTPEHVENMSEKDQRRVVNAFYESNPRHKFKESYPFLMEGMIQKDFENSDLKVYTSRLGSIKIPDTRSQNETSTDYVYFMVSRPGVYGGFLYDKHPPSLVSAKFKSKFETVINGYAIIAHPIGSREQSVQADRWICWNDSLGVMNVQRRAAMQSMKKQPNWDMQLDIVSFDASYRMGLFVIDKVTALTNQKEKRDRFPQEMFLLTDAVFKELRSGQAVFYSETIKAEVVIAKDRIGNVQEYLPYELVVVPSFSKPTKIEFCALLIIQSTFWTKYNQWIRDMLAERTDAYRI
ncbi:hypothetical protein L5515_001089 [Caenorhabditis briggsae]|uniref:Uncharacterized protein n=1 Tax=Caenorhabditis briggsae TaxID=6238 RepID=A0AAE9E0E7_CAEBR|nr:hypothetical protein L5515_001089 [Caenorhabditis briggsae]